MTFVFYTLSFHLESVLLFSYLFSLSCMLSNILQIFKVSLAIFQHYALTSFFFYQGFPSRTVTTHRTAGQGRGPSFIPLYHFHPLTNIQTFICNFACEMTITFLMATLVLTRLLLDEIYHLIELPFE